MAQSISKSPMLPNCKRSKLSIYSEQTFSFLLVLYTALSWAFLAATEVWCFLLTHNGLAYYDICLSWDIAYGNPDPHLLINTKDTWFQLSHFGITYASHGFPIASMSRSSNDL